jgi:hypothetical protein
MLANMDNPDTWALVSEQRADLFKRVMSMALENLSIAQHRDTLWYAMIRGSGYRPQVRRFEPGDYVYLQQTTPTTLDVTTGRIILRVREVLGSEVLLLEGLMVSSGWITRAIVCRVTCPTLMGQYTLAHLIFQPV